MGQIVLAILQTFYADHEFYLGQDFGSVAE